MANKLAAAAAGWILLAALAVPLSAQTIRLNANIPFRFTVNGVSMPAGNYMVEKSSASSFVTLSDSRENTAVAAPVSSAGVLDNGNGDEAKLYFHRYGDQYFLSQIWDGPEHAGIAVWKSRAEIELLGDTSKPATVTILARR